MFACGEHQRGVNTADAGEVAEALDEHAAQRGDVPDQGFEQKIVFAGGNNRRGPEEQCGDLAENASRRSEKSSGYRESSARGGARSRGRIGADTKN